MHADMTVLFREKLVLMRHHAAQGRTNRGRVAFANEQKTKVTSRFRFPTPEGTSRPVMVERLNKFFGTAPKL
jgi:hypothetical protein